MIFSGMSDFFVYFCIIDKNYHIIILDVNKLQVVTGYKFYFKYSTYEDCSEIMETFTLTPLGKKMNH